MKKFSHINRNGKNQIKPTNKENKLQRKILRIKGFLKWIFKSDWIFIFKILGAILIFGSWIIENYLRTKWETKLETIRRSEEITKLIAIDRDMFEIGSQIFLHFLKENRADSITSLNTLIHFISTYDRMVVQENRLVGGTLKDDTSQEAKRYYYTVINYSNPTFKLVDSLERTKNIHRLHETFEVMHTYDAHIIKYFYNRILKDDMDYNSNINKYNNIFICLYILGSVLLGVSFLLEHKKNKRILPNR